LTRKAVDNATCCTIDDAVSDAVSDTVSDVVSGAFY